MVWKTVQSKGQMVHFIKQTFLFGWNIIFAIKWIHKQCNLIWSNKKHESINSSNYFKKLFKDGEREIALEFYCATIAPMFTFRLIGLLRHASEEYTITLFRDFEHEFKMAISCSIEQAVDMRDKKIYIYVFVNILMLTYSIHVL